MTLGSLFFILGVLTLLFALIGFLGLGVDLETLFIAHLFFGLGWLTGGIPFPAFVKSS